MSEPASPARRVLLGRVVGAHGIRGDVLIRSHTGEPEAIARYGALTDAEGRRGYKVKVVRVTPKGVIARFEGVVDRTAAEQLKGLELYAERRRLPPTAEREFYHADLIGLAVVDVEGHALGEVASVQNFGAGDLIEIRLAGRRATELVPFTDAFVPDVDVSNGRMVVNMPVEPEDDVEPETEAQGKRTSEG